jgi:hypothetical protein
MSFNIKYKSVFFTFQELYYLIEKLWFIHYFEEEIQKF